MSSASEETLREMVRLIVEEVGPERIILFGSMARGEAGPVSDVDLLVVEDEPFSESRSRRKEEARLWRALSGLRMPKDILVFAKDEVEHWRTSVNHIIARALREGRVLYERQ